MISALRIGIAAAVALVAAAAELPMDENRNFAASGLCAACHGGIRAPDGEDVSFDSLWRTSMHAHAAADPYVFATIRAEAEAHPDLRGVVEDVCATCHMPMARTSEAGDGRAARIFGPQGLLDTAARLHGLAADAVSCALCHRIEPDGLGTGATASGGFRIADADAAGGPRRIYGPNPPDTGADGSMEAAVGFRSAEGPHMRSAAFCAPCHTLRTPYVDSAGRVRGRFPEQMTYAEWRASTHAGRRTCQDCHMPRVDSPIAVSAFGRPVREGVARHSFVGANARMLRLFGAHGALLGARADSAALEAAAVRTVEYLSARAAAVSVRAAPDGRGGLAVTVAVRNLAGHKLPTGFPSRRAWIRLTVTDARGRVLFRSGGVDTRGAIVGNDNDADAARFEPHRREIRAADEVQIYETILGTLEGGTTTDLLRAARYRKDNRLLPEGFRKEASETEVAVAGAARRDPDFRGGGDTTTYRIPRLPRRGPFRVTAELLYQAIGHRWAENLRAGGHPETARFFRAHDDVSNAPEILAADTAVVAPLGGLTTGPASRPPRESVRR